ncbi:MAG: PorP/SprF family type IX secretion system membrane protein [Sphingobacteriales bacterium]|nr:PorP/SprF family type IX secretion system membrane protein [Sphingobacteriales bacterium]MBP8192798.1 PorP/SprF family type IX secretion system membrane protein [Chitinophagales bacterium]
MKYLLSKIIISLVLIFTAITLSKAQDPTFAQFYQFRTYLNPAATGSEKGLNVAMIYKNQWNYVPGGFNTYGMSVDVQSARISSGVGITAYRDVEAKTLQTNYISASYAYIARISKNINLHIGVNGAFVNKSLDRSRLIFTDQLDPEVGVVPGGSSTNIVLRKVNMFDLDAGILLRFRYDIHKHPVHNSLGFAVHHLTRPDESFENISTRIPMRFTVTYGAMFPVSRGKYKRNIDFYVSPVFKFDFMEKLRVYNTGMFATFKPVYAGVMYQLNKFSDNSTHGLIFVGGIDWDLGQDNFMTLNVGYSYQLDFTGVTSKSRGQHEVTMRMNFNNVAIFSPKKKKGKKVDCYDFPGKNAVKLF